MSKVSKVQEVKNEQGYSSECPKCQTCKNFLSDFVPIAWMLEENERYKARRGDDMVRHDMELPNNQKETNLRCALGGFAVKKTAHCNLWNKKA